jgi:peptidoglycan-associated lipoprotein
LERIKKIKTLRRKLIMKISNPLSLIAPILFVFYAYGCSKNLPPTVSTESSVSTESTVSTESKPEYVEPDPGFLWEENVDEFGFPSNPKDRSAKESGQPGKVGDTDISADFAELFLLEKGANIVSLLSPEEEARRQLTYLSSDQLLDMFFAFDMYDLDDQLLSVLQENVAYLKSHPFSKIVLHGHCDERGSNSYNISLGEQRAHAVKSYLVFLGVDENRIHTVSYGEEKPFCVENNENCWYQNRRVSFLITE